MFLTKSWPAWHFLISPCKIQKQSKQIIPLHTSSSPDLTLQSSFLYQMRATLQLPLFKPKPMESSLTPIFTPYTISNLGTLPRGLHICCSFLLEYSSPTYIHASHSHLILKVLCPNVTMSVRPSMSTSSLPDTPYSISNFLFLLKSVTQ